MASSNACWGIEIGAYALKAVKLEATGDGKCKVVDHAIIPHPKVLSTPGVDANEVLRVTLGAFTSQYDLSKAGIAVSIPGHSSFARFAKLPPVEPKKVPGIVKFEAAQQIPFPLEQVEWDYQTFVTPDSPDVEAGIFAVTKDRVKEKIAQLADVGIVPTHMALGPIAVYNALAYDLDFGNQTPGTIIVDVGTTSTDLVVATPGRMWVRTFPLGGHQFTEALVNQFQLTYPKAEKLKREAQDTKHARQVFQAMRVVFTDLAQDIQRSIGYFQSVNRDAELVRVIGLGNTFRLPGLRKYLKQQLGMDIYRIEQFKKIGAGGGAGMGEGSDEDESASQSLIDPSDKAASLARGSLELVTAYGLALQGLGLNSVSCNLMPVEEIRKSLWKDKTKWFVGAAGVALAASAVLLVGPVQAHLAAGSVTPDASINSAINAANAVKSDADNAGVTKGGEANLTAANLLALQDRGWVYPRIARDIQDMLAAANQRAQTWGQAIGQEFTPQGAAMDVVRISDSFVPPTPDAEGDAKYPAIDIVMQVDMRVPEARRFFNEAVSRWLRDNATRADVEYIIQHETSMTRVQPRAAGESANRNAMDLGTGGGAAPTRGGGRDDAPGGRTPNVTLPGQPASRGPRVAPGGVQPAGATPRGRTTTTGDGGGGSGAITEGSSPDQMAPLVPQGDPEAGVTAAAVAAWRVILKPYTPPAPAEGESGNAGGGA